MRILPIVASVLLASSFPLCARAAASAPVELPTTTAGEFTRRMEVVGRAVAEQAVPLRGRGATLAIDYASRAPVDIIISFPSSGEEDPSQAHWNPLEDLRAALPPGGDQHVRIDLSPSPAWSPDRDAYVLILRALEGTELTLHDVRLEGIPTMPERAGMLLRQLFTDEPPLPSSIVFLYGYRVNDRSLTAMLGMLVVVALFLTLLAGLRRFRHSFLLCTLLILLAYDARFTFNVVRTEARDVHDWTEGRYRQLESLPLFSKLLEAEAVKRSHPIAVAVCSDEKNLLFRWLRYALFPLDVRMAQDNWDHATHAVIIASSQGGLHEGKAVCGALSPRPAQELRRTPEGSSVLRFDPH